jgi:hypothetical protein
MWRSDSDRREDLIPPLELRLMLVLVRERQGFQTLGQNPKAGPDPALVIVWVAIGAPSVASAAAGWCR